MVDQYVTNLRKYHAIAGDCGLQDGLLDSNRELDRTLSALGVAHRFETYEGDHVNRIGERMAQHVLPFFSTNLSSSSGRR
jgi:hypothetical protein